MATFYNPVQGPRIVPYLQERRATDRLPNGRPAFRVTQRFNTATDAFFPGRPHLAMDIGNFYCGDKLLAMRAGLAEYIFDTSGALGIQVTHGSGWKTQLWHISRWRVPNHSKVRKGQWIADVGSTGLDIGGCHCHVVVLDPMGRPHDPWPTLIQNQ